MDRMRQPAMEGRRQRRRAPGVPARDQDDDRSSVLRRGWALTRWLVMVVVIGAATGAAIAIGVTLLLNLLDANL